MSQKRHPEDGKAPRGSDGSSHDDKRRKVPTLKNVVLEEMKLHSDEHLLEPILEPLIRKVVKEEVELALRKHLNDIKQNCGKETHFSEQRSFQLHFLNTLSLPVFTGARMEGEDCPSIQVALVDCQTEKIVRSAPESSAKVEIVVLEGDFDGDEDDNWTSEEFKNNVVREREGKKPLLTGDAVVILKNGVGCVGEISFTDNSSWTRSRRFRLGARMIDNFNGIRVREAKTESFVVRDHRGELYKKHHPPVLLDEVWRLEKIGKDGAFHKRLNRENINTVKDFLTLLYNDPSRLRNTLGPGMSAKMWDITVEHARTCVLDKEMYVYCPSGSQQKICVVFNVVGQVMGLLSECQFVPIEELSDTDKVDAHNMMISAFEHWGEVVPFEDEASVCGVPAHFPNTLYSSNSPKMMECSSTRKFVASQKIGGFDYTQATAATPDMLSSIFSGVSSSGLDDYGLHGIGNMGLSYDQTLSFPSQVDDSGICDTETMTPAFCDEDHMQLFDTDLQLQNVSMESPADLQSAVDGFLLTRSTVAIKAQRRWKKLFCVIQWFSVRRIVALKRTLVPEFQRYPSGMKVLDSL